MTPPSDPAMFRQQAMVARSAELRSPWCCARLNTSTEAEISLTVAGTRYDQTSELRRRLEHHGVLRVAPLCNGATCLSTRELRARDHGLTRAAALSMVLSLVIRRSRKSHKCSQLSQELKYMAQS